MDNNEKQKGKIEEEGPLLMEYSGRPANRSNSSLPFNILKGNAKKKVKTQQFLVEYQLLESERWRTVEVMEQDKVVQWSN